VGNRLSKSTASGTDSYAISPTSNRLASINGSTTKSYIHDPNGSITGDGTNGFAYDPRGRLVSSTSAAGTTTYQVNALGQRVRKTSNLGDVVFHYDVQGRLIAESSPSGTPIREYLWLWDQPVAVAAYTARDACPATPSVDASRTFAPFERRERMEVRSGRPGERGWEWGLGTNSRDFEASARADLDWVSGKPYAFTLTYDGAGNARVLATGLRSSSASPGQAGWTRATRCASWCGRRKGSVWGIASRSRSHRSTGCKWPTRSSPQETTAHRA
jgi:YD repeat-containing protein